MVQLLLTSAGLLLRKVTTVWPICATVSWAGLGLLLIGIVSMENVVSAKIKNFHGNIFWGEGASVKEIKVKCQVWGCWTGTAML